MELARLDCRKNLVRKYQCLDVLSRDDHSLAPGKAHKGADGEETGDLLVDPAYGLDVSQLVDRTCDCNVLAHRKLSDGGKQGKELCR